MNTVVDFKSYYEVFVYRKYKCHADRFIQKSLQIKSQAEIDEL